MKHNPFIYKGSIQTNLRSDKLNVNFNLLGQSIDTIMLLN